MIKQATMNRNGEPLPLPVIMAAISGDEGAIRTVIKHYEGYILAFSVKRLRDEDGNAYLFVDEDLRRDLETRLIAKVLTFKPKAA
jgi:hypothetical protein